MPTKARIKYIGKEKKVVNKFGTFESGKEVIVEDNVAIVLSRSPEFELIGEPKPEKPNKTEDK